MGKVKSHAVGIDLGTTYSCVAWLNEHGQPVTIPNQEGELATPSVLFLDGDDLVVGTEALRNAIAHPDRVIQNAKRFIGDPKKAWTIGTTTVTPEFVSCQILQKLLDATREQIGDVSEAVITVPAQFSDAQRRATATAGLDAGLDHVEIINEPVAAALCHVLGTEGLAFTELAIDQQLLIFDLGGGTQDLAVVRYTSDSVTVVASDGDLELGGLDWTRVLVDAAAERFISKFGEDPRSGPDSHQALMLEAEQAKRSLSVRPRATVTIQHNGQRLSWQVERDEFVGLCEHLIKRSNAVTRRILADNRMGWAHIDAVLTTGGASRMPMIKKALRKLSGRTLNTTLSPDQSIAHGAAYYAGMLLSNRKRARTVFSSQTSERLARMRQQSVNARSLGILIRNVETGERQPHYLIPPNCPLPVSRTHVFGTVVPNQTNVRVRIVEGGAGPDKPHTELGECIIQQLPPGLPQDSQVAVTISYDTQARVHVTARELHEQTTARVDFVRSENLLGRKSGRQDAAENAKPAESGGEPPAKADQKPDQSQATAGKPGKKQLSSQLKVSLKALAELSSDPVPPSESAEAVVLRCPACNRALNRNGECESKECLSASQALRNWAATSSEFNSSASGTGEEEFWDLVDEQ